MKKINKKNFENIKKKIKKNYFSFINKSKKISKKILKLSVRYVKTNVLFFTFILTSVFNGFLLRCYSVRNIFDISPVLADLAVVLLIASLGYFLKPKHQFKYFFTWSIILTTICIINSVYYTNYLSFASFSLLKTALQLVGVESAVTNLIQVHDFYYLVQILAMIFINRHLKKTDYFAKVTEIEEGKIRALNTIVIGLITLGMFISTLSTVDISRLNKQWRRDYLVMKFGVYTYQINDLTATIKSKLNPLFGLDKATVAFREFYGYDETTDEDAIISTNKEINSNAYTGILEGYNVITIHAESIQNYLLETSINGEYVVPNFRKIASEGLYFSNFYSQESVGTSSDTEFTFSTSLLPATSGTVFVNYFDRDYVTLQKLLKEKGYYVFSMHGNNCSFWNRNASHRSLGYDNFYCYTKDYDIDETVGIGLSDKSFFKQSVDIIKNNIVGTYDKFYGTMIMLSNHTPFNKNGEAFSDYDVTYHYQKYNELTGEYEDSAYNYLEGTQLGYYFKSAHYADESFGQLMAELDEAGILDNTIILIYGDHDSKLRKSEYSYFYNFDPTTGETLSKDDENYHTVDYFDYELNRKVPLILWTKNEKLRKKLSGQVTKVMGMYDVLPTIGNMLGIKSDYALGHDIFSIDENVVVFPDGNWLTDKMYYNRSTDEGRMLNIDETVSADYIDHYNKYADKLISISDSIVVYDLIKKVNESEVLLKGTE